MLNEAKNHKIPWQNVNGHFKATFLADKARQATFLLRYKTVFDINVHTGERARNFVLKRACFYTR